MDGAMTVIEYEQEAYLQQQRKKTPRTLCSTHCELYLLTSYINGLQCKSFFLIWDECCLISHGWHWFNRIHRVRTIRPTHCKSNMVITGLGIACKLYKWKKKPLSGSGTNLMGLKETTDVVARQSLKSSTPMYK